MSDCLRCHISGRVQGVWYRASTREQAERLGIRGYAHNLQDGRVEVLACGDKEALRELREWLWQGSKWAQVEQVECSEVEIEALPQEFTTR